MDIDALLPLLQEYSSPAIFVGAFLFGETVILAATFLAAEGLWSFWEVFVLSFFGGLIADILWFLLGRYAGGRIKRWQWVERRYHHYVAEIEQDVEHTLYYIILFKFLYGTRIITILYTSMRRIPFLRFLLYDAIGTALLLVVIMGIGYFIWLGFPGALSGFRIIQLTLIALLVLTVLFRFVIPWAFRRWRKKDTS